MPTPAERPPGAADDVVVFTPRPGQMALATRVLSLIVFAFMLSQSGLALGFVVAALVAAAVLGVGRFRDDLNQRLAVDGTRLWLYRRRWTEPVTFADIVKVRWSHGRPGSALIVWSAAGRRHRRRKTYVPLSVFGEATVVERLGPALLRQPAVEMNIDVRRLLGGRGARAVVAPSD
jgi:hypothetical protein